MSADSTPPPSGEQEAASIPSHDLSSVVDTGAGAEAPTDAPAAPAAWGAPDSSPADQTPPPPPAEAPPAPGGSTPPPPPPPEAPPAPGNYPPPPAEMPPPPAQPPAGAPPAPGGQPPPSAEQAWGQAAAPAPSWGAPAPGAPAPGAPPAPGGQPPAWGQPAPAGPPGPGYGPPASGQGYPAPGAPGFQQQAPASPAGPPDPNGLGVAAGRLGNRPRKDARSAFAVAGAVLKDGEDVEAVAAGKFEGNAALLVLTDQALVLVDDRPWKPTVERITVDSGLQVQGWQDDRTASLTLVTASRQMVLDSIVDRPLAVEMAQRVRYRTGS